MRSLTLAKNGLNKVRAHHKELKQVDIDDSLKSIPPGEWCLLKHSELNGMWLCFINSMIDEKYSCVQLLEFLEIAQVNDDFSPLKFIEHKICNAYIKRQRYQGYENGSRLVYGIADGLPGLIIDNFQSNAVIQINTAGLDKYRDEIKKIVEKIINGKAYFLDNAKYREKELLPTFKTEPLPALDIEENGLRFHLRAEVMQKVGFYYDHRENRYQLIQILNRLKGNYEHALDLFSYVGAWGLAALKAGAKTATFVDQGDFGIEINMALELNGFKGLGQYLRADVFKFLDEAIHNKNEFDLILCDPPAFAKSHLQKNQALDGYSKLHRKVFKVAKAGALVAFSSCTHYVSHEEFQKNINEAAQKENKRIQLLYTGLQGWDHPVTSQLDKSNYIKSYFYLLES